VTPGAEFQPKTRQNFFNILPLLIKKMGSE
jgi:hypothetical protein